MHGTAAERLRNAIKLRLKSPLKDRQERKKVHVTGINEEIFLWPENRGYFFFFLSRVRTMSCICSKGHDVWITDLALK